MDFKKTTESSNSESKVVINPNKPKPFTFSNRELDILACLLGKMQTKKIASYLSLSPSTVETHIRNLMTKIGCNSRKEIIAFIEQSEHNQLIKKHSTDLLIKIAFEQELKEIVKFSYNTNCAIFYYKTTQPKSNLIPQLEKHLTLAGITVSCKAWNRGKPMSYLASNKNLKKFVIYCLDNASLKNFNNISNILTKEITEIKLKNEEPPIILFLSEQPIANNIKEALSEGKIFVLSEQKNYYLLIFELLKFLVPSYDFAKTLEDFNAKHDVYNYTLSLPKEPNKPSFFNRHKFSLKKTLFLGISILFLVSILILGINNFIHSSVKKIHAQHVNNFKEKEQTILINLPQRNFSFTGRKKGLRQIREHLNKYRFGTITQAISGLGGVGKTQLALEFAYQAAENNVYSAILWITAETENSIYNSYKEIANTLQLKADGLSLENMQSIVHNKLAAKYKKTDLLIVLDNAPSYKEIKNYVTIAHKELMSFLTPHILITSRSQQWPELPLMLDNFTAKEALVFVKKHLPNESIKSINRLTKTLNYFPLALGQAVSYIKNHTNINDYLEIYQSKQKDYLDQLPTSNNQYNASLWKTWNISFDKLNDEAKELLFISAYLSPDNIPITFFDHLSTEKRAKAIAELRKYSLINLVGDQSFKIHRLLQEVIKLSIRSKLPNNTNTQNMFKTDSYWLMKAMNLLKTKFDFDYLQPQHWKQWNKYLSQAQVLAKHAIATPGPTLKEGLKLYIKYAMFLTYIRYDGKHATEPWTKISSLVKQQDNSKATKFILSNITTHLAYAKNWLSKYQEASDLINTAVLPTYKQPLPTLRPEEQELFDLLRLIPFKNGLPDRVKINCDLNFAFLILDAAQYNLGLLSEALISLNKGLESLGQSSLDRTSQYYKVYTLANIGCENIYLGNFHEAEKVYTKIKDDLDQLYTNHPRKASVYVDLATLMYHLGKFNDAISLLEQSAKIKLAYSSPQHPENADIQLILGLNNYKLGNFDTAKNNFKNAAEIYKLYNYEDFVYVFSDMGLWLVHEAIGEYEQAINYMQATLTKAKFRYQDNINSIMSFQLTQADYWPTSMNNADLYYWQQALQTSEEIFGVDNYQSARYHYMVGLVMENAKRKTEATFHYKRSLAILSVQKIRHPCLKKFYRENIEKVTNKIKV